MNEAVFRIEADKKHPAKFRLFYDGQKVATVEIGKNSILWFLPQQKRHFQFNFDPDQGRIGLHSTDESDNNPRDRNKNLFSFSVPRLQRQLSDPSVLGELRDLAYRACRLLDDPRQLRAQGVDFLLAVDATIREESAPTLGVSIEATDPRNQPPEVVFDSSQGSAFFAYGHACKEIGLAVRAQIPGKPRVFLLRANEGFDLLRRVLNMAADPGNPPIDFMEGL